MNEPIPQWLVTEVASGLQRLLVLSLNGAPAAETITATAMVWCDAIRLGGTFRGGAEEARDRPRLEQAFRVLAAEVERWPAPRQLLERLPALPQQYALPERPKVLTAEERRRIAALLAKLDAMTTPQERGR